jgi:hypothetical protein
MEGIRIVLDLMEAVTPGTQFFTMGLGLLLIIFLLVCSLELLRSLATDAWWILKSFLKK